MQIDAYTHLHIIQQHPAWWLIIQPPFCSYKNFKKTSQKYSDKWTAWWPRHSHTRKRFLILNAIEPYLNALYLNKRIMHLNLNSTVQRKLTQGHFLG